MSCKRKLIKVFRKLFLLLVFIEYVLELQDFYSLKMQISNTRWVFKLRRRISRQIKIIKKLIMQMGHPISSLIMLQKIIWTRLTLKLIYYRTKLKLFYKIRVARELDRRNITANMKDFLPILYSLFLYRYLSSSLLLSGRLSVLESSLYRKIYSDLAFY